MKLHPCPFCGLTPITKVHRYSNAFKIKPLYFVRCPAPMGKHSCFVIGGTRDDAMRQWNRAVPNVTADRTANPPRVSRTVEPVVGRQLPSV